MGILRRQSILFWVQIADVRNAIAQIRQDLPQDINDPIVERLEFSGGPVITYAVKSDRRSVEELSNLVDQTISRAWEFVV